MITIPALLGALSFASAAMLGWTAAVAVPIVLHFWNRRRYQEVSWGAMDFLIAAIQKDSTRLRIEQFILLMLRVGAIGIFAFAVADPRLTRSTGQSIDQPPEPERYLLILDTSYSMDYRARDQTRLESAIAAAKSFVDHSPPGDGFSVVLMANPPQAVIGDFSTDKAETLRVLSEIKGSQGGADLSTTLAFARQIIESALRSQPSSVRPRMIFLTDMGRTTWNAALSADCRSLIQQVAQDSDISIIDVDDSPAANLAIANLETSRPFMTLGETGRIDAEVRSFNANEASNVTVEFLINGRVIDSKQVTVPTNGRVIVSMNHRFDTPGDSVIEAKLSVDGLTTDNQRWFVVPVLRTLRVLCVEGEPEAADYVALALNPTRSVESTFQSDVVLESGIMDRSLKDYDCVFLNNIPRFNAPQAALLSDYVKQGGGLVIALGDLVQPESYNRELAPNPEKESLLPARIEQLVRQGEHFFDPLEYRHRLVAPFQGHQRAGLLTVPTWRYFRLRPYTTPTEVPLAFSSGDAAIVVAKVGRGRSLLIATALSASSVERTADGVVPWTALPTWPSFPPLVHGIVREATQGREQPRSTLVGSAYPLSELDVSSSLLNVRLPDGSTRQVTLAGAGNKDPMTLIGTDQRGVYHVSTDSRSSNRLDRKFAVNVDTIESDLARTPLNQLPDEIATSNNLASGTPVVPRPRETELFRAMLGIVVVLLVSELFFASWFGRRT